MINCAMPSSWCRKGKLNRMLLLLAVVLLLGALVGAWAQAREDAEAEMSDEDFDHNEGEETYDEDL